MLIELIESKMQFKIKLIQHLGYNLTFNSEGHFYIIYF